MYRLTLFKSYKVPYILVSSAVGTVIIINNLTQYIENLIKNDVLVLYSVALFAVYVVALIKLEVYDYDA